MIKRFRVDLAHVILSSYWIDVHPLGSTWIHSDSIGFTRIHLDLSWSLLGSCFGLMDTQESKIECHVQCPAFLHLCLLALAGLAELAGVARQVLAGLAGLPRLDVPYALLSHRREQCKRRSGTRCSCLCSSFARRSF